MEKFFGVWVLDRAAYGDVPAPLRGVYTILPEEDTVWFQTRWQNADGQLATVAFRAAFDRTIAVTPLESLTMVFEDDELVTRVLHEDRVVYTAKRRVDGDELTVTQQVATEEGPIETEAVYRRSDVKQVMIYRRDLKMRKGKIAAQCAHASLAVFFRRDEGALDKLSVPLDGPMAVWSKGRFAKVVLSVDSEEELVRAYDLAMERGIPAALITDSGKTEFGGVPTRTTVALGPAAVMEIDEISGPSGLVPTKLA